MKKVYIGIDAHKESNTVALAFGGNEPPELCATEVCVLIRGDLLHMRFGNGERRHWQQGR